MASPTLTRKFSLSIKTVLSPRTRGGSSPDPSYFEEYATQYTVSEKHRNDIFHDSLHHFQHEFSKQEDSQTAGERTREEEFVQAITRFDEAFTARQHRHEHLYMETDTCQEGIFKAAELQRQAVFLEGQKIRASIFQSDQVPRAKRSEWHSSARATLIQKARENCTKVCITLEASLIHQFNTLLKFQDEEFCSDEQRRDGLVRTILEGGIIPSRPHTNGAETHSRVETNSPASVHQEYPTMNCFDIESPRHSRSQSQERNQSRDQSQDRIIDQNRSPSPTTCPPLASESATHFHSLFMPIIPANSLLPVIPVDSSLSTVPPQPPRPEAFITPIHSIPPVIPFPSASTGDSHPPGNLRVPPITIPTPSQAPSSAGFSQNPTTAAPVVNNGIVETPGNTVALDSPSTHWYDERFKAAEKERHHHFLEAERERERHFRTAEASREEAEAERMKLFLKNEENRSKQSQYTVETHEAHFKSRAESREDAELRRQAVFKAAQDRRWLSTCGEVSHIEQQADAEQRFEQDMLDHQKSVIEVLYRTQLAQLEAARDDHHAQFIQAQARRNNELGVAYQPLPPKASPIYVTPVPAMSSAPYPFYLAPAAPDPLAGKDEEEDEDEGFSLYDNPQPDLPISTAAAEMPASIPRARRHSHTAGFSPNSFLSAGPNVISTLPIPKLDDPPIDPLVQLQALRQELSFVHLQRKHQHEFEKFQEGREEAFDKANRRRSNIFHAREAKRNKKFERAQRLRSGNFWEEEVAREAAFREAQRIREASFQTRERKREAGFRENETSRDEEFKRLQEYRSHNFHVRLLGLQKFCIEAGKDRTAKLDAWGKQLVQWRDSEQRRVFEDCRREYEETFELSLGSYASAKHE